MPEWVRNESDKPIPEPYELTIEEQRFLHLTQRRAHLEKYDDRYKQDPLSPEERARMEALEARIFAGTLVTFRGVELRFAPGQIYQVPDGTARAIAATSPKLRALTWEQVRNRNENFPALRFETPQENKKLLVAVAGGDEGGFHHGTVDFEMKDGLMRYGDGKWEPIKQAG